MALWVKIRGSSHSDSAWIRLTQGRSFRAEASIREDLGPPISETCVGYASEGSLGSREHPKEHIYGIAYSVAALHGGVFRRSWRHLWTDKRPIFVLGAGVVLPERISSLPIVSMTLIGSNPRIAIRVRVTIDVSSGS